MAKLLFLALGDNEVPAIETLTRILEADGHEVRAVTWLPRLATARVVSLQSLAQGKTMKENAYAETFAKYGFGDPSMAADYDRDWYFASVAEKARHVARVFSAVDALCESYAPDLVVSSVGGETSRVVLEAVARCRSIPTAYFNGIPLPQRFVLLKSLDAPFVPYLPEQTSFLPDRANEVTWLTGKLGKPPRKQEPSDVFARTWERFGKREKSYPASWIPRKAMTVARGRMLRVIPARATAFQAHHTVKILYPLHDERDFQVAVRERHAIPQEGMLRYLSSELPAGFHIYVKPHPEHLAAHHSSLWRNLAARPNVHFLPAAMPADEAINSADVILTLASSMGLEALRARKPVVCYGSPFYSRRGATMDVRDPRELSATIQAAVGTVPDGTRVASLVDDMIRWSWPGSFTPLNRSDANLTLLANGLRDAVASL